MISAVAESKCLLVVPVMITAHPAVNRVLDNAKEERAHSQEDLAHSRKMAHAEAARDISAPDQKRVVVAHNMAIVERRMITVERDANQPLGNARNPAVL